MNKRVIVIISTIIILLTAAGGVYRENILCEYQPIMNINGSQMTSYEEFKEYYGYHTTEPTHYKSKGIYQKNGLMYEKKCSK